MHWCVCCVWRFVYRTLDYHSILNSMAVRLWLTQIISRVLLEYVSFILWFCCFVCSISSCVFVVCILFCAWFSATHIFFFLCDCRYMYAFMWFLGVLSFRWIPWSITLAMWRNHPCTCFLCKYFYNQMNVNTICLYRTFKWNSVIIYSLWQQLNQFAHQQILSVTNQRSSRITRK